MAKRRQQTDHLVAFDSEDNLRHAVAALLTRIPDHKNVQITHGPLEKGKDIIFSIPGSFGHLQYCACVVKNTPISADHSNKHRLSAVLGQVRQAFTSPFLDSNARDIYISRCHIVCPHQISQLTLAILKEELAEFRTNLEIVDGPQLFTLLQRYYPEYKADEFDARSMHLAKFRDELRTDKPLERLVFNAVKVETTRDTHLLYVAPTFEAVVRQWEANEQEMLLDLSPKVTELVRERAGRGRDTENGRDFPFQIVEESTRKVTEYKEEYAKTASMFGSERVLSKATITAALAKYDELTGYLTRVAGDQRTGSSVTSNSVTSQTASSRAKSARGGISDQEKREIESMTEWIGTTIGQTARMANSSLAEIAKGAKRAAGTVGFLEDPTFVLAQRISDHFSFLPNRYVSCLWADRVLVEERSFHGSSHTTLVVAPAGYGKTSFCRWHTLEDDKLFVAGIHRWMPIYIQLHKLTPTEVDSLTQTVTDHATLTIKAFSGFAITKDVKFRVYLDGLDEVTDEKNRHDILDFIKAKKQLQYPTDYILTSRDHLVGSDTIGISRISIRPLNEQQIEQLAELWLKDRKLTEKFIHALRASASLRELARIPLLCTLIILIYQQTLSLPQSRLALYENFIELLCSGWNLAKGLQHHSSFSAGFKELVLRKIASDTHFAQRKSFSDRDIARAVARIGVSFNSERIHELTSELTSDGILQRAGELYEFQHLSFQEYLTALDLFVSPSRDAAHSCLESYLSGDNWWRDVLEFYVLQIRSPADAVHWIESQVRSRKAGAPAIVRQKADHLIGVAQRAFAVA